MTLPDTIRDEAELDDLLASPSEPLVGLMARLGGDLAILGVAGKMGLSLAWAARRASDQAGAGRRIYGVSRFSNPAAAEFLRSRGVEPVPCDLLDPSAVAKLPEAENVVFMAGRKFGTEEDQSATWAVNTLAPANVARRYAASRVVAFSTGCVYPLVTAAGGGCTEQTPPAPVGEYAQSCLGRERVLEYFSRSAGLRVCLLRLNYAVELRYGVLHDIARAVLAGEPVDLSVPAMNVIWQGDANAQALGALELCESPPAILNVTGPETLSVREVATALGAEMRLAVRFAGSEGERAYLNDASRATARFGRPRVPVETLLRWTARWVQGGGASLNKPTHFQVNTGRY